MPTNAAFQKWMNGWMDDLKVNRFFFGQCSNSGWDFSLVSVSVVTVHRFHEWFGSYVQIMLVSLSTFASFDKCDLHHLLCQSILLSGFVFPAKTACARLADVGLTPPPPSYSTHETHWPSAPNHLVSYNLLYLPQPLVVAVAPSSI